MGPKPLLTQGTVKSNDYIILKDNLLCIADLFLLSHWSIILLSFKLLGGPTSSQKIFTRPLSQLGSKS
jgi:hypothetical protein